MLIKLAARRRRLLLAKGCAFLAQGRAFLA